MTRVDPPHFPDLSFGDESDRDDFMQQWYGKHLRSMDEPRLHTERETDTIRLLTLPTFHEPTLIRIERHEIGTLVCVKRTDGRGGYGPGALTLNDRSNENSSLFNAGCELLDEVGFWQMPVLDDVVVLDGTRYIIESSVDDAYHVLERAVPKKPEERLLQWLYSLAPQLNGG